MKSMDKYYSEILKLAKKAAARREVPIGAIVVGRDGQIIGRGYNRTNGLKNVFQHAELRAIRQAQTRTGDWRLEGAKLYVTLEPCLMCLGAVLLARIREVHFILEDPAFGSLRTVFNRRAQKGAYKQLKFYHDSGLKWEVAGLMKKFFEGLRKK